MRAAVDEATSSRSSGRLPRLLFGARNGSSPLERLDERLDELVEAVAGVVQEVQAQRRAHEEHDAAEAQPRTVWLFVSGPSGYRLVEHDVSGPLSRGSSVWLDDVEYRVAVVRRSPLLDDRRCAYLEPLHPAPAVEVDDAAPAAACPAASAV